MEPSQLRPKKPIAEMTEDEFDAWRVKCRELRPGMTREDFIELLGLEVVKQCEERVSGIDDEKLTKIVSYMASLHTNLNECVMVAAVSIAMQLEGAPEDVRAQAVETFPTKLEMALTSLMLGPEPDKSLS